MKLFQLTLISAILCLPGCVVPPDVKERVQTETAIQAGYVRLAPTLSNEQLIKIIKKSERVWQVLNHRINDGPLPPEEVPTTVSGTAR